MSTTLISIVTVLLSILGLVISLLVYYNSQKQYKLSQKSFSDDHHYNRCLCALNLIEGWDKETLKSRTCLMNQWKERFKSPVPIAYDEIKRYKDEQIALALEKNINPDELITVTEHIQIILNYFENLALAIDNNIADDEVLQEAFLNTFERWYHLLSEYKNVITKYRTFDPWAPLDKLHERWFPQKHISKNPKNKTKTGDI